MKHLLEELYTIEPELREKEESLEKIVAHMIELKPEVHVPEHFKRKLERRIIGGISPEKERRVYKKNKYFRFFWYILGTGALASFMVSFGLLSIFQEIKTKDTLLTVSTEKIISLNSGEATVSQDTIITPEIQMEESRSEPMILDVVGDTHTTPPQNKEKITKKEENNRIVAQTTEPSNLIASPTAISMMSVEVISTPSEIQESTIAYVGENISSQTMGLHATDSMVSPASSVQTPSTLSTGVVSKQSSEPTPLPDTSSRIVFQDIVLQAQQKADLIIGEMDRSFYILKTPHIEYVSRESTSLTNTVEMEQVYVFPLERTDGKKSIASEIRVVIP